MNKTLKLKYYILLLLFVVLYVGLNVGAIHSGDFFYDSDYHFFRSILYFRKIMQGERHVDIIHQPYPPLLYILTLPFYKVLGVSAKSAVLSVQVFTVIFLLALFGIGYEISGVYAGFGVMFLGASSPYILNMSRCYYIDFPLTALFALFIYFLIKSHGFSKTLPSVMAGFTLALAFLTKWSILFYGIPPLLWCGFEALIKSKKKIKAIIPIVLWILMVGIIVCYFKGIGPSQRWYVYYAIIIAGSTISTLLLINWKDIFSKKKNTEDKDKKNCPLLNFFLAIGIAAVLTLPWYMILSKTLLNKISLETQVFIRNYSEITRCLLNFLTTSYSFLPIFIIIGLFSAIRYKEIRKSFLFLAVCYEIAPVILIFPVSHPVYRYFLPLTVGLSALGGGWIKPKLKGKFVYVLVTFVICTLSVLHPSFLLNNPQGDMVASNINAISVAGLKVVYPIPYKNLKYNLSFLDYLKSYKRDIKVKLIFYITPPSVEQIIEVAFNKGVNIIPVVMSPPEDVSQTDEIIRGADAIVILYEGEEASLLANSIIEKLKSKQVYFADIGEGVKVILIKINRSKPFPLHESKPPLRETSQIHL